MSGYAALRYTRAGPSAGSGSTAAVWGESSERRLRHAAVVFRQVAMDARSPPYLADSDDVGQRPEMGHNPPLLDEPGAPLWVETTGSPEAVARPRFPQNVARGFPHQRSS